MWCKGTYSKNFLIDYCPIITLLVDMRKGKRNVHYMFYDKEIPHAIINLPKEVRVGVCVQISNNSLIKMTLVSFARVSVTPIKHPVKCLAYDFGGIPSRIDEMKDEENIVVPNAFEYYKE